MTDLSQYSDEQLMGMLQSAPPPAQAGGSGNLIQDFSNPQNAGMFMDAVGHNIAKPFMGATQLVEHGFGAAGIEPQATVASDDAALANWEKNYQANTPNNAITSAGATVGTIAPYMLTAGGQLLNQAGGAVAKGASKLIPQALADASPEWLANLAPKVVSGVTQGGIIGAASPVTSTATPYADQKKSQIGTNMAVGGAIPIATTAAQGLASGLKGFVQPLTKSGSQVIAGNTSNRLMGGSFDDNLAALQNGTGEYIPGSTPTTAQILADKNNPGSNINMVQAEKAVRNSPEGQSIFGPQQDANNTARLNALNQLAGTPEQLKQAIADRNAAASAWTGPEGQLKTGNPVLAQPLIDQVYALQNSDLGQRSKIGAAAGSILNDIRSNTFQVANNAEGIKSGPLRITPGKLDAIRQNINDTLGKFATIGSPVSSQETVAFQPLKTSIIDAVDSTNPGYRDYLANFAKNSVPINDMQAATELRDGLSQGSLNSSGEAQATLSGYNSKLKQALNTEHGVSPEAQQVFDNIGKDIQRATISSSGMTAGSPTVYNSQAPGWLAKQMYGDNYKGGGFLAKTAGTVGGFLSGGPAGAYGGWAGANNIAKYAGANTNKALAEALATPAGMEAALQAAKANQLPRNAQLSKALTDILPTFGAFSQ